MSMFSKAGERCCFVNNQVFGNLTASFFCVVPSGLFVGLSLCILPLFFYLALTNIVFMYLLVFVHVQNQP